MCLWEAMLSKRKLIESYSCNMLRLMQTGGGSVLLHRRGFCACIAHVQELLLTRLGWLRQIISVSFVQWLTCRLFSCQPWKLVQTRSTSRSKALTLLYGYVYWKYISHWPLQSMTLVRVPSETFAIPPFHLWAQLPLVCYDLVHGFSTCLPSSFPHTITKSLSYSCIHNFIYISKYIIS